MDFIKRKRTVKSDPRERYAGLSRNNRERGKMGEIEKMREISRVRIW